MKVERKYNLIHKLLKCHKIKCSETQKVHDKYKIIKLKL